MLGVLLALLSSTTFGINNAAVRRGVVTGTAAQAVAVSLPVGLVVFAAVALLGGQLGEVFRFSPYSASMFAAAGVVHFVFGRYCAYRAIKAMGANLAAPVTQWSLMVSLVLAIVLLGESLDALKVLGIVLVVLGPTLVIVLERARAKPASKARASEFKPDYFQGYLYGILCCVGWGSSPVLIRAGLAGNGFALAGGVVSYASGLLATLLVMLLPGPRREVMAMGMPHLRWFAGTGLMTCISQILLYMATAVAPVIVVQPIMRFQTVVGTLCGWYMNRQHEVFDSAVLGAIGVSMLGAVVLAFDSGTLLGWLGSPPGLAALFSWRWP